MYFNQRLTSIDMYSILYILYYNIIYEYHKIIRKLKRKQKKYFHIFLCILVSQRKYCKEIKLLQIEFIIIKYVYLDYSTKIEKCILNIFY